MRGVSQNHFSFGPHEVKAETQCHLTLHAVYPWTRLYFFPIIFAVQWQALIWTDKKQHPFSLTHFKRSFFQLSFDICLQKITGRDYPCFHLELSSSDHSVVCFPWLTRPAVYSSPYREAFILSVLSAQMWTHWVLSVLIAYLLYLAHKTHTHTLVCNR